MLAIVPYEPWHRAMLPVRREQVQDLEFFHQAADLAASLGPAFSAVEQDDDGKVTAVLACAGLAETSPDHASAWAAFGEGLSPSQWAPIVRAMRSVVEGCGYASVDMMVRHDWPVAKRFAEWLGFAPQAIIYARPTAKKEA